MKKLTIIFLCALPAALAACGGGGGGGHGDATFSPLPLHDLAREPAARSTVEQIAQTHPGNHAPGDTANTTYDVRKAMKSLYKKGYKKDLRISSGDFPPHTHGALISGHVEVAAGPATKFDDTKFNVQFNVSGHQFYSQAPTAHARGQGYNITYDAEMLMYETSQGTHSCTPTFASAYPTAAKAGEYGTLADLVCHKHHHKTQTIVATQQFTYTTSANPSGGLNFDVTRETRDNETDAKDTVTYNYLITADGVAELTGVRLKFSQPGSRSYDVTAH